MWKVYLPRVPCEDWARILLPWVFSGHVRRSFEEGEIRHSISKPIQERNWFKRHLNWTAYLSSFITSTLVIITRLSWGLYPNYVALSIIFTLVSALIFILLWVWLLKSKKRSLWWLLLAFVNGILTYYAWWPILPNILLISYFFMSNKTLDIYQQPEDDMEPQP